jgi:hypothetical protein
MEEAYEDEEIKREFPGVNRLNIIQSRSGITANLLYKSYHEQDGLCAISGFPMSDDDTDGWYAIDVAPKIIHRQLSDSNFVLVCSVINRMKPETMRWEQFRTFCENIADRERD